MVIFYKCEIGIHYIENPEIKGVNLVSKTHCNGKSNLKLKTVFQELLHVDRSS